MKEDAIPKFHRPRPLPLALKAKVEKELECQMKLRIIQKVDVSEWGTPIVPVVNHYSEFLRCLADLEQPAQERCGNDQTCFEKIKVLADFDPDIPISLACDASAVGIGAVIYHKYEDGTERPIAYASKTLSSSEKNYSQIEREALSIIFGVKKFH